MAEELKDNSARLEEKGEKQKEEVKKENESAEVTEEIFEKVGPIIAETKGEKIHFDDPNPGMDEGFFSGMASAILKRKKNFFKKVTFLEVIEEIKEEAAEGVNEDDDPDSGVESDEEN